ncbi:tail fiber protein [Paenibacillus arenosi]|uniref:Phage tail protein n=1 Tax=Paenibacillus arenosi TaxID=2774142 RepID=A0ABR9B0J0_9BACL|nr:phage tail protein [Paenibacillus arenosi]
MMESYVGEIRMFGGNFAPQGWALCNGQLISIAENEVLFSLIGTTYGGDGQTTFALPDLRGRIPLHTSNTLPLGSKAGTETVTLISSQLPAHTHQVVSVGAAGQSASPTNMLWAASPAPIYGQSSTTVNMNAQSITAVGGNQPHDNMMPTTTISFIISLYGVYPSQG